MAIFLYINTNMKNIQTCCMPLCALHVSRRQLRVRAASRGQQWCGVVQCWALHVSPIEQSTSWHHGPLTQFVLYASPITNQIKYDQIILKGMNLWSQHIPCISTLVTLVDWTSLYKTLCYMTSFILYNHVRVSCIIYTASICFIKKRGFQLQHWAIRLTLRLALAWWTILSTSERDH